MVWMLKTMQSTRRRRKVYYRLRCSIAAIRKWKNAIMRTYLNSDLRACHNTDSISIYYLIYSIIKLRKSNIIFIVIKFKIKLVKVHN